MIGDDVHVPDPEIKLVADTDPECMSDEEWKSLITHHAANTICHLYLCEATHLALRPNQLYNFTVDPTCKLCVALAHIAAEKGTI